MAHLEPGFCFGDWGLLNDAPRTASIFTLLNCYCITLSKEKFLNTFGKGVNKTNADKVNFINSTMPGMREFGRLRFDEYYKKMLISHFEMNDTVFKRNQEANFVFLIFEGRFEMLAKFNGRERKLIELEKGDIAGFELINGAKIYEFTVIVKR